LQIKLPLPEPLLRVAGVFRFSMRMFWPVFLCIGIEDRLHHRSR